MKTNITETKIQFIDNVTNEEIAHVEFELEDRKMSLTHTFVNDNYRGQGLAGKLMEEAVKFAASHQLKIVPVCSYAVLYFEKHPQQ